MVGDGTVGEGVRPRLVRGTQHAQLSAWASQLVEPMTIAELASMWWPEVGDPLGWRVGAYPLWALRRARARVRRLERARLVVVEHGPLRHRSQVGSVVRPAEMVTRQSRIAVGGGA